MTKQEIARRAEDLWPSRAENGRIIEGNHTRRMRVQATVKAFLLNPNEAALDAKRSHGLTSVRKHKRIW